MNMIAIVIRVDRQSLLVRNTDTGEEVLVLFRNANAFSVGDLINIIFNGEITHSVPPQITAISIQRLGSLPIPPAPQPTPNEIRAIVLQRGANFLLVQNTQNRQLIRVTYDFAHHFCAGQRVTVRYTTITMGNPPRITAIDVIPIC